MPDAKPLSAGADKPRVVLLTGNAKRPSKSRALAHRIGERLAALQPVNLMPLDLCDAGRALGTAYIRDELSSEAESVVAAIENADALVVVTPIHNGSYPGLFKHLIDFVARGSLANKPVLLGAAGGSRHHAMVIETQLMPLFAYFRAQICPYNVFESNDEEYSDAGMDARIDLAARQLTRLLCISAGEKRGEH